MSSGCHLSISFARRPKDLKVVTAWMVVGVAIKGVPGCSHQQLHSDAASSTSNRRRLAYHHMHRPCILFHLLLEEARTTSDTGKTAYHMITSNQSRQLSSSTDMCHDLRDRHVYCFPCDFSPPFLVVAGEQRLKWMANGPRAAKFEEYRSIFVGRVKRSLGCRILSSYLLAPIWHRAAVDFDYGDLHKLDVCCEVHGGSQSHVRRWAQPGCESTYTPTPCSQFSL
ncbi:hypothetical protein SISSUDRAFT_404655 [Sistotremastrum suecicum HHB10207 ss-3]|uniref:Uncharacterized protein n=1 Tax=Sistotremastrum suecicum HHB10207 ss-3 TaxID=1314776 RepID=A0A165YRT3_9AGAM|nr:hypothetical protein SISSUDRAFT_404655 [Sistotremastrum suecicum HHB10207 ss-3]